MASPDRNTALDRWAQKLTVIRRTPTSLRALCPACRCPNLTVLALSQGTAPICTNGCSPETIEAALAAPPVVAIPRDQGGRYTRRSFWRPVREGDQIRGVFVEWRKDRFNQPQAVIRTLDWEEVGLPSSKALAFDLQWVSPGDEIMVKFLYWDISRLLRRFRRYQVSIKYHRRECR